MITLIINLLINIFGFDYDTAKKWARRVAVAAVVLVVLVLGIAVSKCGRTPAKLNEAEIQQGEAAVKQLNDNRLIEVLANADVRQQGIDNSIKAAEEAKRQAVANYSNYNSQQLAEELERRK